MTNEIAVQEGDLIKALQSSVYVDASTDTIKLVLSYCKALSIDPLIKPVHIVPIGGKDVLFPSVALHRIRAHRSGAFLGMSDPVYGKTVTEKVGQTTVTYPYDCKVTIRKLVGEHIAEFSGFAVWRESYQTIKDKVSPNHFWYKRPFSQLYKCAEADALKKAFPEIAGSTETFEERREEVVVEASPSVAVEKTVNSIKEKFVKPKEVEAVDVETGEVRDWRQDIKSKEDYLAALKKIVEDQKIDKSYLDALKRQYKIKSFSELGAEQLDELTHSFTKGVL